MPLPSPQPNESESDFIERAHKALASEFPDTDQRNAVVFRLWREHKGQSDVEKKSYMMFDDRQFVRVKNVPVFKEHEYRHRSTDEDGNEREVVEKYDLPALKKIIERCNHRIADTSDFAPLAAGHTLDPEETNPREQPEVVGFAGPFRLGMIGTKDPKWAIFEDEVHYRDKAEEVARMPRRSPELFLKPDMAERFFDPVSVLGSVTPRSDLGLAGMRAPGVHYARTRNGQTVAHYSAPAVKYQAAAMPGPGAVDPVGDDGAHPKQRNDMGGNAMDDETIRRLMEAFRALPELEYVRRKMEEEAAPRHTSSERDAEGMETHDSHESGEHESGEIHSSHESGEIHSSHESHESEPHESHESGLDKERDAAEEEHESAHTSHESAHESGEHETDEKETAPPKKERDMATATATAPKDKRGERTGKVNYAAEIEKLRGENQKLKVQNAEQGQKITALEQGVGEINSRRINSERQAKLGDLRRIRRMDIEKEKQRCAADKMSDQQFLDHCDMILENFEPIPVGLDLFTPDLPDAGGEMEKQKNAREVADKAMARHLEYSKQGKYVSYDDCKREVAAG